MENKEDKQFSVMDDERFMEFLTDQFGGVRKEIQEVKDDLLGVKGDLQSVKDDLQSVKDDLQNVKSTMVTKSFLTDKLIDLKGDLILKLRQEDSKVNLLIQILSENKAIKESDIQRLKEIEVFPVM